MCAAPPHPSWNSAVKPVLERPHMKQPEWRYCGCGCHMPQEPRKRFQWGRCPASKRIQAIQHLLDALLCESCSLADRVQLHTEKYDPLYRGEFAVFPVTPKSQPVEVTEHHVPVFAQLVLRLLQYQPAIAFGGKPKGWKGLCRGKIET